MFQTGITESLMSIGMTVRHALFCFSSTINLTVNLQHNASAGICYNLHIGTLAIAEVVSSKDTSRHFGDPLSDSIQCSRVTEALGMGLRTWGDGWHCQGVVTMDPWTCWKCHFCNTMSAINSIYIIIPK